MVIGYGSRVRGTARRMRGWCRMVMALGVLVSLPAIAGDAERTKALVASVCSACHGLDGNSVVPAFPKLAGRHPDYLVNELKQFSSGARKSDIMGPIAAKLDAADMRSLGEYFGAQKPTSGKVLDPDAAAAGKKFYQDGDEAKGIPACGGCHGQDASGNKRFPRLAGQHREYLIAQMNNFRNDVRDYNAARLMREVAKLMSEDDIKAVAEYLQGL